MIRKLIFLVLLATLASLASSKCDEKACTYGVGAATAIGGIGGTLADLMCVPTLGSACILGNLGTALSTAGLFASKFCGECTKENEEESKITQGSNTPNDPYVYVSNLTRRNLYNLSISTRWLKTFT